SKPFPPTVGRLRWGTLVRGLIDTTLSPTGQRRNACCGCGPRVAWNRMGLNTGSHLSQISALRRRCLDRCCAVLLLQQLAKLFRDRPHSRAAVLRLRIRIVVGVGIDVIGEWTARLVDDEFDSSDADVVVRQEGLPTRK